MKQTIDITTIATLRPDILWTALMSVRDNLRNAGGFRLILDVAPVGDESFTQEDVVKIATRVFPNIITRALPVSFQAEAQKWVWGQAESDLILQWEDDWVLLSPLEFSTIAQFFEHRPRMAMLFFDRREKPVQTHPGYRGMFEKVAPGFFLRVVAKNFGGPPAVVRREYLRQVLPYLRDDEALDITCRRPECQLFLNNWEFGVLTDAKGQIGLVKDIGKEWRRKRGLKMRKDTPRGVQWRKG